MDKKEHCIFNKTKVMGILFVVICNLHVSEHNCYGLEHNLKIGSFNIQVFGKAKMEKPDVVEILVKIIRRYDIILIQEIRDSSGKAISSLLKEVNRYSSPTYDMVISKRLGRTSSKEQYAFLYQTDVDIVVKDTFQHPDWSDVFEREPFSVLFHVDNTAVQDFVLVGIHTSPETAVEELNQLELVHLELQTHWKTENILIMGDFNADCGYVSKRQLPKLSLKSEGFHWWIPDDADTTVKGTDCAYDRFVMSGDRFISSVVKNSPKVFHFEDEYSLSQTVAEKVSDHYPIELEIAVDAKYTSTASTGDGVLGYINKLIHKFRRFEL